MTKRDIVIIGAGLSGLLIAAQLKRAGMSVRILEARDRIGGRIFTHNTASDHPPLEMGATWFGDHHPNLLRLLSSLGLDRFPQLMNVKVHFEPGPGIPPQLYDMPPQAPNYRIKGGTSALIQALADGLAPDEVYLSQPVRRINSTETKVQVATDSLDLDADIVISTLPPALLARSIHFEPELPAQLMQIAQETHTWMGDSVKAALVYKQPFWQKSAGGGTLFSHAGPASEFYDQSNFGGTQFALCGFINPACSQLSVTERTQQIVAQLTRILGSEAQAYSQYREVLWAREVFTRHPDTPATIPHQHHGHKIFGQSFWQGKLMISGSETSPQFGGYMEGAVVAAMNTVRAIRAQ